MVDMAGIKPRVKEKSKLKKSKLKEFKENLQERYENLENVYTPAEKRMGKPEQDIRDQEKNRERAEAKHRGRKVIRIVNLDSDIYEPTVLFDDGSHEIVQREDVPFYKEKLKKGTPMTVKDPTPMFIRKGAKKKKASGGKVFANSTRKAKYKAG
tara:strand:+ start:65 stop:526 length:462 start_codon:yes stop_codon:yes gene_type:complete